MGLEASAGAKPQTMWLGNMNTDEALAMQYNPEELAEVLGVNWIRLAIVGQSYEILNYINTRNHKPAFTLTFDELTNPGNYDCADARRFLLALCYPQRGANDIRAGAPPRVLFVWPQLFSMVVAIDELEIRHRRFAKDGHPTLFAAKVQIEEARTFPLFADEVRQFGTQRRTNRGAPLT